MEEQALAYGKWYYCTYLLMRIVCWFALGWFIGSVVSIIGIGNYNALAIDSAMTFGTGFAMIGGFLIGIYRIIMEE